MYIYNIICFFDAYKNQRELEKFGFVEKYFFKYQFVYKSTWMIVVLYYHLSFYVFPELLLIQKRFKLNKM